MAHTKNSITIKAPYDRVFDITNDIERWTELFEEYTEAKIISREGNKITFQLTNNQGNSWRSWRLLDKENRVCTAQREEPLFPFKYMNLKWTYEEGGEDVKMTWEQDFEMDPKAKFNDEQAEELINKHSVENMKRIKELIESGKV
ncbi:MAG: SRPBCC family protein [Deltaproteobacteria bacterium]|nr:SRPBCC family protein [Deltaproteobacteria bacterium]